jgi:hypothetical protein
MADDRFWQKADLAVGKNYVRCCAYSVAKLTV